MSKRHRQQLQLARSTSTPTTGEATGIQSPASGPRNVGSYGGFASATSNGQGFNAPDPGTFDLYRKISSHPTIALIRAIVTSPIRTNVWGWDVRPDADPLWLEMTKAVFDPQRPAIIREALRALEFGVSFGEQVWDACQLKVVTVPSKDGAPATKAYRVVYGSGPMVAQRRVKPLLPDTTEPLIDGNGNVRGLKNKSPGKDSIELIGEKVFRFSYDGEAGNPWGRSRHENIRKHYAQADQVLDRLGSYSKKIAGIILQLHYPDGTSKDASGADRPNFEIAKQLLQNVADGKSVALINKFASLLSGEDGRVTPSAIEKALAAAGKSDWVFSFLDAGGIDFAPGFLDTLAYYDKCFCRGWLRPERTALEATSSGSRADSVSHTDTAMADSMLVACDIAEQVKLQLIDPMLVANFGEDARGAITPEPSPMADTAGAALADLLKQLLTNPATAPSVARKIDVDAIMDDQEIPIVEAERGPIGDGLLPMIPALKGQQPDQQSAEDPQQMSRYDLAASNGDGRWVTMDGEHVFIKDGVVTKGPKHLIGRKPGSRKTSPSKQQTPKASAKSILAKKTSRYVGAEVQRYSEEHNEPMLAKGIAGVSLRDNEPVDVMVVEGGVVRHGVELKTMTENKQNKIYMKADAMAAKAAWMRKNHADFHTVVYDDQQVFNAKGAGKHDDSSRQMYYKRGYGSFRVNAMHPVGSMEELKTLMNTPTKDLPAAARPSTNYPRIRRRA